VAEYRVCFFNDLPDSTGHDHHVCQRTIEVSQVEGEEQAIVMAIREFERLEGVSHWNLHARKIECALMTPGA